MKRLGTLCMTALAIATCSLALVGCGKTSSKTGTCEPDPGSTKAIEKNRTPGELRQNRRGHRRSPGFG